ncbi:MAG: hypothetical protein J7L43_02805, partial [Candidatus Aenigmarchaeota archaeon]|nr:hypothetical protein [Candidatus Aenigmarchaeota archaeon]
MASKRTRKKKLHKKEISKTIKKFHLELRKQMATFITGAFSFVAALIWRDAIRSFIDSIISKETLQIYIRSEWLINLIIAIIVTIVAVIGII